MIGLKKMRKPLLLALIAMLVLQIFSSVQAPQVFADELPEGEAAVSEPIRVDSAYGAAVRGGDYANLTVSGGASSKERLEVKWSANDSASRRSHLQFNMPEPDAVNWADVEKVMLVLYVADRFGTRNQDTINVFSTDNPGISEENWTWNNTDPLMGDSKVLLGGQSFGGSLNGTWVEIDITNVKDRFIDGNAASELFLALYSGAVDDQAGMVFASQYRENAKYTPHLMIYEQYVDKLPPNVTVTGLTNGQQVTSEQLTFTINAIDNVDANPAISLIVNGGDPIAALRGANTVSLLAGRNVIEVSAVDAAGNRSASQVFVVEYERVTAYPVVADAYTDIRYPNTNYNGSTEKGGLHLKTAASGTPTTRKVYLSFDLSANTKPYAKKAVIQLFAKELMGTDRTSDVIGIYEVPAFNEQTLTSGNAPANGDKAADATYERKGHNQPIYLDISQYINRKLAALAPGQQLGTINLVLQMDNGHDQKGIFMASKENDLANAAKLLITEGVPAPVLTVNGIENQNIYFTDVLSHVEIKAESVSESVDVTLAVAVNGQNVTSTGNDLYDIPLRTGTNKITIVATDSERNETRAEYTLTRLVDTPVGTYYVDSAAGNDNNDGTSEATPWKSLEKLNAAEFKAGSTILFKRGSIWNGQFRPHGSGTAEAPIVVDAYGEASAGKPIINGNGISHLDTGNMIAEGAVHLYNLSGWELRNLEVTNTGPAINNALRAGIMVVAGGAGDVNDITISNVYVHDVNSGTGAAKFSGGILFKGDTVDEKGKVTNIPSGFNRILVENSHVKNVAIEGLRTKIHRNGQDTTNIKGTDIVFRNNLIEEVYGDGIVMAEVSSGGLIEKNIVRKHSKNPSSTNYAGLWLYETNAVVIQYNEVYDGVHGYNDGEAFDFDINVTNNIYQYNYSHHNRGGFLLTMTSAGAGNIFRYNISKNDGQGTEIFFCMQPNTAIYNNTIYIGEGYTVKYLVNEGNQGRVSNMNFKNNIVQVDGTLEKYSPLTSGYDAPNVSHNLFYPASIASLPGSPKAYASLVRGNPMLTNPAAADEVMDTWDQKIWDRNIAKFKLQTGSPAIDAGTPIANPGEHDIYGTPLYYGDAPDIGAHELGPVDKTDLNLAIEMAEELLADAAATPGKYLQAAIEALDAALLAANETAGNEAATQTAVDEAWEELTAAIAAFKDSEIPAPAVDELAPTWPNNSAATVSGITQTSLTVFWTAAEDNVGVTKYVVSWAGGSKEAAGDARSVQLTGLSAGTSYTFKVEAVDAAGNRSANGPSVRATTNGSDPIIIPEKPTTPVEEPEKPVEEPEQPVEEEEQEEPGEETPKVEFKDVAGHWAEAVIKRAAELAIVKGHPDQVFKPDAATTRAEFITMLANLFKWEAAESSPAFADSGQIGSWAAGAVAQGIERGIIQGYTDGTFRPNQQITRAEMAVMLARALGLKTTNVDSSSFADDDSIPQWAKSAIEELRKSGLLTGRGNNTFAPKAQATRAEAVVVLLRILEKQ